MADGFVVWFTGLSGSGKSTLSAMLSAELRARDVNVIVLDGDEVRTHLSKGLSFSKEDRDTNVRRIGYVAKLIARAGGCAMTAAISPYRAVRDEQRAQIERFVEVFCECSVEALTDRDPKGLYRRAIAGEIQGFTGVNDPYEPPEAPEVVVRTGEESKEESLARILAKLEQLQLVPQASATGAFASAPGASSGAVRLNPPHGGELHRRFAPPEAAAGLQTLAISARALRHVERIGAGIYSPLRGFMTSRDYLRVVREMRLESGLLWAMPITLAVTEAEAEKLRIGERVALQRDGRSVGVLEISELYRPDKAAEAEAVFGAAHPDRADPELWYGPDVYVAGEVLALGRPDASGAHAAPGGSDASLTDPAEVRAHFAARGWSRLIGYAPAGVMQRGEEYLTKAALEFGDGLVVHTTGSRDGLPFDLLARCHEALFDRYYPAERVRLAVVPTPGMPATPLRQALHRLLVQKSFGCSHVLVAAADAAALTGAFAERELGVVPLAHEEVFYSLAAQTLGTAKTAPENETEREMWQSLARREPAPPALTRPEVSAILLEWASAADAPRA